MNFFRSKRIIGFSLIELMVVIAIVAILSTTAMPVYVNYRKRAIVSSQITLAQEYLQKAIVYYNTHGIFPPVTQVFPTNEGTWDSGRSGTMNTSNINSNYADLLYYNPVSSSVTYPQLVMIGVRFADAFTGGVTPSQKKGVYFAAIPQTSGMIKIVCGQLNADPIHSLDGTLMPANCTETNLQASYWSQP